MIDEILAGVAHTLTPDEIKELRAAPKYVQKGLARWDKEPVEISVYDNTSVANILTKIEECLGVVDLGAVLLRSAYDGEEIMIHHERLEPFDNWMARLKTCASHLASSRAQRDARKAERQAAKASKPVIVPNSLAGKKRLLEALKKELGE
jgi:hypothetical protein